jgi:hypothetical protein
MMNYFQVTVLRNISKYSSKRSFNYATALKEGFKSVQKKILTSNQIIEIQGVLKKQKSGFRKLPGTEMVKPEVVYTPTTSP